MGLTSHSLLPSSANRCLLNTYLGSALKDPNVAETCLVSALQESPGWKGNSDPAAGHYSVVENVL